MNMKDTEQAKWQEEKDPVVSSPSGRGPEDVPPLQKSEVKSRKKPLAIADLGQLLRAVYDGKFSRKDIKKSDLAAIRSAPSLTDSERDQLIDLAQSDLLLEKTRQLMLLSLRIDGPTIPEQIREFARRVLAKHPIFIAGSLADVLANPVRDKDLQALLSIDRTSLKWPKEAKPQSEQQWKKCKKYAAHCVLLLSYVNSETSLDRVLHLIQDNLWIPASQPVRREIDKLYALIDASDPVAASTTYEILKKDAAEQRRKAETALREKNLAEEQVVQLEARLSGVERELVEARDDIDRLFRELQEGRQEHAAAKAHWSDDYEQLRGHMLRRLKEELSLLDEGLHALQREPPKVHVMIDHAERAIDGLKSEMVRLRGKR
jgi:hypothetical protein